MAVRLFEGDLVRVAGGEIMRHIKSGERPFQSWIEGLYLLCGCRRVIQRFAVSIGNQHGRAAGRILQTAFQGIVSRTTHGAVPASAAKIHPTRWTELLASCDRLAGC